MAQQAKGFKINGVVYDLDLSSVGSQTSINFSTETGNIYNLKLENDGTVRTVRQEPAYSPINDYGPWTTTNTAANNTKFPPKSGGATELGGSYISSLLRINSCYFGGSGNPLQAGCAATHNFVELGNATDYDLNLNGVYLFYAGTGAQTKWDVLPLEGTIPAHGTYLIRGAKCSEPSNVTVDVMEPDMTWYSYESGSYNYRRPLAFDPLGGTFYLALSSGSKVYDISGSAYVDPYKLSMTNPYNSNNGAVPIPGYIDLCGCQASGVTLNISEGGSACVSSQTSIQDTIFFRQYGLDPGAATVLKQWSARKTSAFWTYCRMNQPDSSSAFPYFDAELKAKLAPGSSKHPKSFGSWRKTFKADKPNCINISFGKQATETAVGSDADRCFNWISKGYYDEYVEYRLQGSDTWLRKYSISSIGDHKFDVEYVGDNVVSTYIKVYDRIRWITPTGDNVTTHKAILRGLSAGTYEYRIGRLGDENYHSDIRTFKVRSNTDIATNGFNFVHVTDQQGFDYNEYLAWEKAAYAISQEHSAFDFIVNTGDIAQSGTRECEWIDYYEGKASLGDVEEMVVVGNNDLCGRYYSTLGDGTSVKGLEHTKMNSYSVWLFYCADLDANNPTYMEYKPSGVYDSSKLGVNVIDVSNDHVIKYFIPLVYSFNFGEYHFTMLNSEFMTNDSQYLVYNDNTVADEFRGNSYYNLYKWMERDFTSRGVNMKNIVLAHEIPFCIVPKVADTDGNASKRTATNGSKLNGDFSRYIATAPTNYAADVNVDVANTYYGGECFSTFFQEHNYRLCLGGHKHTYSLSYPTFENITKEVQFTSSDYTGSTATFLGNTIYLNTGDSKFYYDVEFEEPATRRVVQYNNPILSGSDGCFTRTYVSSSVGTGYFVSASAEEPSGSNPVVYAMSQATGYKLESNKDVPGRGIPWLYQYYACSTTGVVNTGQQYPMYHYVNVSGSEVKLYPYIVTGITSVTETKATLFNLNSQISTGPISQRMADVNISGSVEPIEYVINY